MVRWRRWWWTRTWWLRPPLPEVSHSLSTGQGKVKGHNESNTAFLIYPFISTQFTIISIVSGADLKMGMRVRSHLKTCVFVTHMTLQWVRYDAESKLPLPKYIPKRALEITGWRFYCSFRFGSSAKSCWWSGLCCIWSRLPGRQLFSKERSTSRAWHSAHQGKLK